MKFRIGDVCEVVAAGVTRLIGRECTIIAINGPYTAIGYDCDVVIPGMPSGWNGSDEWSAKFSQLRLKRPPGWDIWLEDTSSIEHENKVSV